MSHFTVLVITEDKPNDAMLAKIFAPFYEQTEDKQYIRFHNDTKTVKDDWNNGDPRTHDNKPVEGYDSFESFAKGYYYYKENPIVKGEWGYMANPNSKWDWYVVGGRWLGTLQVKEHVNNNHLTSESGVFQNKGANGVDSTTIGNLDHDKALKVMKKEYGDHWDYADKEEVENPFSVDTDKITREDYIDSATAFTPHAILLDDKWYESGNMGWWGCVHDPKDSNDWASECKAIIDSQNPNHWITLVDCHI